MATVNPVDVINFDPQSIISGPARALGPILNTGTVTYDTNFPQYSRAIWVNVTGKLSYKKYDGTIETLSNVVPGIWHPIAAVCINSVDTTIAAAQIRWGN